MIFVRYCGRKSSRNDVVEYIVNLHVRPRGLIDFLPMSLKAFVAKTVVNGVLI